MNKGISEVNRWDGPEGRRSIKTFGVAGRIVFFSAELFFPFFAVLQAIDSAQKYPIKLRHMMRQTVCLTDENFFVP